MSESEHPEGEPKSGPGDEKPTARKNWFGEIVFWIIAGLVLAIKDPLKILYLRTYTRLSGDNESREPVWPNIVVSTVLSLIAGISVGYELGFVRSVPLVNWVTWGVAAIAATFLYGYPLLYLIRFKFLTRLSQRLWAHVDIDGFYDPEDFGGRKERRGPSWLSSCLLGLTWLVNLLIAFSISCWVWHYCLEHRVNLSWIWSVSYGFLALVGGMLLIAGLSTRGFRFIAFLALVFAGLFWGRVSGVYHAVLAGPGGALTYWDYVPVGLASFIAFFVPTVALGGLVYRYRIRMVAVVTGLFAANFATPYSQSAVAKLSALVPLLSPLWQWVFFAVELYLYVAFVFPACHILLSSLGRYLRNIRDLMHNTYFGENNGFRELTAHLTNLACVGLALYFCGGAHLLGVHSGFALYAITAVSALLVYAIGGSLFVLIGPWPVALTSGFAASYSLHLLSRHYGVLGPTGDFVAYLLSFVLTVILLFPLAYQWMYALTDAWLTPLLGKPLAAMYERFIDFFSNLVEELAKASAKAYGDKTPYRQFFVHTINIVVALAVLYLTHSYGKHLGLADWLTDCLTAGAALVAYLFIGKGLIRYGARPVGFLVAAIVGYIAGTFIFAAQPVTWEAWRFALAVPGGLVVAAIGDFLFPVAYLIVRACINIVRPENWITKWIERVYIALWTIISTAVVRVKEKYHLLKEELQAAKARFAQRYGELQQRLYKRTDKKD